MGPRFPGGERKNKEEPYGSTPEGESTRIEGSGPGPAEGRQVIWTTRQAITFVRLWRQTHPCVDCSERKGEPVFYPYYLMEFDHVGLKRYTLGSSKQVRSLTEAELRSEIAMCDLVCANCHREREWQRQQNQKRLLKQGAFLRL